MSTTIAPEITLPMTLVENQRDDLLKMRDDQYQKLIEIASDRAMAEKIVRYMRSLEAAAAALIPEPTEELEYAKYKRPTDAIIAYLEKAKAPVPREKLITELVEGGFRHGKKSAPWIIGQGIDAFAHGRGRETLLLKEINGMVGLGEWPDADFQA